ncbi:unnamed protein product [Adineta steineri]|uniref:Uncharacterized protein n=1 Tax=Adineta steineri TaxID=433720 RepID=A0A815NZI0_9BILA|nr:unnamed protein product [Adineta steineri]CAF4026794.1 unnamed protein product [Adineta steineri]
MTTIYHIDLNELSGDIINSIKAAFKNKTVDIIVKESEDETAYLLKDKVNADLIYQSLSELENGEGIEFTLQEFKEKFGS